MSKENFQKAAGTAITDEDFNKMVNDLPDDWINSSISGANALYQLYGSKGKFTFHRDAASQYKERLHQSIDKRKHLQPE